MKTRGSRPEWSQADLAAVCAGDRAAGQRFLKDFGPVLLADIARLCPWKIRHGGEAAIRDWSSDRLQDVFVFFFEKGRLLQYDPERGASLGTYLRFIAKNHVRSVRRSGRTEMRLTDLSADPVEGEDLFDLLDLFESDERRVLLWREARRTLSAEDYDLFLKLLQDPPVEPAFLARELGITTATLYKRKERLLVRLRSTMAAILNNEEAEQGPKALVRSVET